MTEGRKQVGGKLEVKLRIRDPFKGKQVEVTKEKWLVIDQFIRALGPKVSSLSFISEDTFDSGHIYFRKFSYFIHSHLHI